MKSLVIYYSKTGNTEKVAKAIAKGLGVEPKKIGEAVNVLEYDLICIGTPVYSFAPAEQVNEFMRKLPDLSSKRGAGFCTMHMVGGKKTLEALRVGMETKGIEFLEGFSCKGLSKLVADFGPKIFNKGKPDEKDLERAENFGRKLSVKAKEIVVSGR